MVNKETSRGMTELGLGLDLRSADRTRPLVLHCRSVVPKDARDEAGVADRQARVPGFSQEALSKLRVLIVGAGAFGGEIAEGLVRKGVGALTILDFDIVEMSNLARQFYFPEDLYQPKAWALARNLQPHGSMGTRITAWALSFEEAQRRKVDLSCDVVVAAADDGRTTVAISQLAQKAGIPAIFGGASRDATYATLFVQEPGKACVGCAFPREVVQARNPCSGSPAVKDVFMGIGALALYAIDSLVMDRPRSWNLHSWCPADPQFTVGKTIARRADCLLCGGTDAAPA